MSPVTTNASLDSVLAVSSRNVASPLSSTSTPTTATTSPSIHTALLAVTPGLCDVRNTYGSVHTIQVSPAAGVYHARTVGS